MGSSRFRRSADPDDTRADEHGDEMSGFGLLEQGVEAVDGVQTRARNGRRLADIFSNTGIVGEMFLAFRSSNGQFVGNTFRIGSK